MFKRSAGILAHPTSFPGRYGIGDLGEAAYQFVDFLVEAKQSLWQILPLGPTGYGDSPYQCFSAFAGNPLMISPDRLVEEGYLSAEALQSVPDFPTDEVDFGWVIHWKLPVLEQAYLYFLDNGTTQQRSAFEAFQREQASWLHDYALFVAIKNQHVAHAGGVWNTWPRAIAMREPEAMARWEEDLSAEIEQTKFWQFLFFDQWLKLKTYANEQDIQIIGDIPIFVAFDSADVWSAPERYHLDEDGEPLVIAGVPPDYFSVTGQRWGNPLYRWEKMQANGFAWWVSRIQATLQLVDIVRIDHFRGFDAYWEIPASEPTAVKGQWVKAPGRALFEALRAELGDLPIIAEDLGVITPEVEALRDDFGLPGMKILQFAFGGAQENVFLPFNYSTNYVVYTGSHDNETTLGWYKNASKREQDFVRRYLARDGHDIAWDMIRLAHASVANTSVIPLQDIMVLGNEARMNFPGKVGGYWAWRYTDNMLADWMKARLKDMTELYGRAPLEEVEEVLDLEGE
ncbi:MAG: 4-alpha-glucanotransferase [Candidatus Promineifilaceae bacterium]